MREAGLPARTEGFERGEKRPLAGRAALARVAGHGDGTGLIAATRDIAPEIFERDCLKAAIGGP